MPPPPHRGSDLRVREETTAWLSFLPQVQVPAAYSAPPEAKAAGELRAARLVKATNS